MNKFCKYMFADIDNEKIDETFKNAVNHHVNDGVCIVYSRPGGHGAC